MTKLTMNKKFVLAIFLCFILIVIAIRVLLIYSLPESGFEDVERMLFTGFICIASVAAAFGVVGWQIYHSVRSRKADEGVERETAVAHSSKPPTSQQEYPHTTGTIGDISARIGYDVRDLLMAGYNYQDIADLEAKRITLEQLFKRGPHK